MGVLPLTTFHAMTTPTILHVVVLAITVLQTTFVHTHPEWKLPEAPALIHRGVRPPAQLSVEMVGQEPCSLRLSSRVTNAARNFQRLFRLGSVSGSVPQSYGHVHSGTVLQVIFRFLKANCFCGSTKRCSGPMVSRSIPL